MNNFMHFIWLLLSILGIGGSVVYFVYLFLEGKWTFAKVGITFLILTASIFSIRFWDDHLTAKRQKAHDAYEQAWQENGCQVYLTECGSKAKYACERRSLQAGRIILGDIVLTTRPTC